MAQIIKKNEKVVAPFFKNGVTLDFYTITFPGDVTGKLGTDATGARSPVAAALEAIQIRTSIEVIGTPVFGGTTTTLNVAVAALGGVYPADFYNDRNTAITFAAYLQSAVRTEGVLQATDLATATVTAAPF